MTNLTLDDFKEFIDSKYQTDAESKPKKEKADKKGKERKKRGPNSWNIYVKENYKKVAEKNPGKDKTYINNILSEMRKKEKESKK